LVVVWSAFLTSVGPSGAVTSCLAPAVFATLRTAFFLRAEEPALSLLKGPMQFAAELTPPAIA